MTANFKAALIRSFGPRLAEDDLCKQIWSALANVDWYHPENHESASYSFRAAGSLIAEMRGNGDYMDWYCSGPNATISDEIRRSMKKQGWIADETPPICDEAGCLRNVSCGWSDGTKYRCTCREHSGTHVPRNEV